MRTETDRAVEILERGNRQMNLEMCALVEELRRERDEARRRCDALLVDLDRVRSERDSLRAELRAEWIGREGRVA